MPDERRCPSCDALVSADAEWCGQCFASLVAAGSAEPPRSLPPVPAEPGLAGPGRGDPSEAFWPCSACGGRNQIAADVCETCGTPFAALMRTEPQRPHVEPKDALARSLLYPGLGHRRVGRATDGFARAVLFTISFGMALLVGFGGVRSGPAFVVFLLLLGTGVAIYVLSAYEAYRLAAGGDVLVASRTLMWVLVGVIFLSVAMLALAVVSATRR